jgi:ferredoxin
MSSKMHALTLLVDDETQLLQVADGANLRQTLLAANLSPYTQITQVLNCGGRGICATCGVWFEAGEPKPENWHDRMAASLGYPRLSCQIKIHSDMTVRLLTDKLVWGKRTPERRYQPNNS